MSKKHRKNFRPKNQQAAPQILKTTISAEPNNQTVIDKNPVETMSPVSSKHFSYVFLENWPFKHEMRNIALVFGSLLVLLFIIDYLSIKTGLIQQFGNFLSFVLHIQD